MITDVVTLVASLTAVTPNPNLFVTKRPLSGLKNRPALFNLAKDFAILPNILPDNTLIPVDNALTFAVLKDPSNANASVYLAAVETTSEPVPTANAYPVNVREAKPVKGAATIPPIAASLTSFCIFFSN